MEEDRCRGKEGRRRATLFPHREFVIGKDMIAEAVRTEIAIAFSVRHDGIGWAVINSPRNGNS